MIYECGHHAWQHSAAAIFGRHPCQYRPPGRLAPCPCVDLSTVTVPTETEPIESGVNR
jgi:hypothetical protein